MFNASAPEQFMVVNFPLAPLPATGPLPDWPLHLTITPWARGDMPTFETDLGNGLREQAPFELELLESDVWGSGNDSALVWRAGPADVLGGLHRAVLRTVDGCGTLVDPRYTAEAYIPHITPKPHQPGGRELHRGDTFPVDRLAIVQKIGRSNVVHGYVMLGGRHEAQA